MMVREESKSSFKQSNLVEVSAGIVETIKELFFCRECDSKVSIRVTFVCSLRK